MLDNSLNLEVLFVLMKCFAAMIPSSSSAHSIISLSDKDLKLGPEIVPLTVFHLAGAETATGTPQKLCKSKRLRVCFESAVMTMTSPDRNFLISTGFPIVVSIKFFKLRGFIEDKLLTFACIRIFLAHSEETLESKSKIVEGTVAEGADGVKGWMWHQEGWGELYELRVKGGMGGHQVDGYSGCICLYFVS